jgi:homoserine O-acetyltransferase
MNGDTIKALRAIKAKTLIMVGTKDLLNPEFDRSSALHPRRARRDDQSRYGDRSRLGRRGVPADVDFLNREISGFFDLLTDHGRKLQ